MSRCARTRGTCRGAPHSRRRTRTPGWTMRTVPLRAFPIKIWAQGTGIGREGIQTWETPRVTLVWLSRLEVRPPSASAVSHSLPRNRTCPLHRWRRSRRHYFRPGEKGSFVHQHGWQDSLLARTTGTFPLRHFHNIAFTAPQRWRY